MMAKDFHSPQEAGDEESTTVLLQDPFEEEDTLSLSDLPIYNDHSISAQRGHDHFSKEDGKDSQSNDNDVDDDDDDFFEFFSEEFTTPTRAATAENIIFCGKLIPFKDPHPLEKGKKKNLVESNTIQKGTALLPWWANSFDKAKPTSKDVTSISNDDDSFKKKGQEAKGAKSNLSCEHSSSSAGKVSLMRSTTKSRWFLFMFGMSRLSNTHEKMELRDIRSRQRRSRSRRGPVVATTMFPSSPEHGEEANKIKARRSCKGLWKVLRSISLGLSCNNSSKLASDVVKAAFV